MGKDTSQTRKSTRELVEELFRRNGVVWGSSYRIAILVGCTVAAVQSVLKELEGEGLVEMVPPGVYMSARKARGSIHSPM